MERDLMELVNQCGVAEAVKSDKVAGAKDRMKMLQSLGFKKAASGIKQRIDPIVKKAQISALGFIEIKPEKIREFLERKAAEYNKTRAKEKKARTQNSAVQNIANAYGELASALMGTSTNAAAITTQNISSTANSYWRTSDRIQAFYGGYDTIWTTTPMGFTITPAGSSISVSAERISAPTIDLSSVEPGTIGRFEWLEEKVEEYAGIPPETVLEKFATVKQKKVFDYYTVASVNSIHDPLLLGRILDSNSRYFIAQWGKDVCLDDVI